MTRLLTHDKWILGGSVLVFGACLVLHVSQIVRGGFAWIPVTVQAEGPGEAPILRSFWGDAEASPASLQVGDRLLSVGDEDLAGKNPISFAMAVYRQTPQGEPARFRVERGGTVHSLEVRLLKVFFPWRLTLLVVALWASGILAYYRAGGGAARLYFLASGAYALHWCYVFGGPGMLTGLGIVLLGIGPSFGVPLTIRWMLSFPEETARHDLFNQLWPWAFAPIGAAAVSWAFGTPLPAEIGQPLAIGLSAAGAAVIAGLMIRNFREAGPAGRRQIKWLVFGFVASMGPILFVALVTLMFPSLWRAYEASLILQVAIPICFFIAITRDHLFDIDRLLTRATTLLVLSFLFIAGPMYAAPAAAEAMSAVVDPGVSQMALAVGMAVLILGARTRLEPLLERLLFRERAALEQSTHDLRTDLEQCEKGAELYALLSERLYDLLRPGSLVTYVITPNGYAPATARGPAVAPAFSSEAGLAGALGVASAPVRTVSFLLDAPLDDFERSALAAMGTEVILPIRLRDELNGFICLGAKASGDHYTGADLALLGSLVDKAADVLHGFGRERLLREERAMAERLQRFVPGAIVERVQQGESFSPGEREVSVLFADIRGYTSFSEGRRPEAIFTAINRYTETVSQVVSDNGGAVVDFSGDGVMAAFGAHAELESKESAAVKAAREIVQAVRQLEVEGRDGSVSRLDVGVGIATGEAFVGTIQSAERAIWCVLGNTTNLAARLEAMTRDLDADAVIDDATRNGCNDITGFEPIGPTDVRGRSEPLEIFALSRTS
jgi:class 3 adenylate cyclase